MHDRTSAPGSSSRSRWRSIGLPSLSVIAILLAIWLIERGPELPFSSEEPAERLTFPETLIGADGKPLKLGPSPGPAAEIGSPAPGFVLTDTNGRGVQLSDFAGRTVLINFWATWCVPCRTEMPDLENAFREHGPRGLVVLGVNLQESAASASEFAEKFGLSFPILLDTDGSVARAYRMTGLPESWIVGKDGTVIQRKIGAFTKNELQIVLTELFQGTSAGNN